MSQRTTVVITQGTHTRTMTHIRIPITNQPTAGRLYALASATTMHTVRAITAPGPFMATGTNSRRAVGYASVQRHRLANAPMR